jgi:hypothetical protein
MSATSMAEKSMDLLIHQVQRIPASNFEDYGSHVQPPGQVHCLHGLRRFQRVQYDVLLQLNGVDVGEKKPATPHYNQVSAYHHTQFGVNSGSS